VAETAERTAGVGRALHIRTARETGASDGVDAERGGNGSETSRVRGALRARRPVGQRTAQVLRRTRQNVVVAHFAQQRPSTAALRPSSPAEQQRSLEKYEIRIGPPPTPSPPPTTTTPKQLLPSTAKEQQFQSTGRRKELTARKTTI